jgi:hypothetical protein
LKKKSKNFVKGFVPRGKNTLTSRLFVLEQVKKELDKQMAAAKLLNKNNILSARTTTTSSLLLKEEEDEDLDYDDHLIESNLLEDLQTNPDACAILSNNENQCLTNEQVYNLLKNRSDLMKFPKLIEQQIIKPNEQICTSIGLSS